MSAFAQYPGEQQGNNKKQAARIRAQPSAVYGAKRISRRKESQCVLSLQFVRCFSQSYRWRFPALHSPKSGFPYLLALPRSPFMNNHFALETATSGRPAIGLMPRGIITGCQELGSKLRRLASCGPPAIGDGEVARYFIMKDIGARTLDFMAA